MLSHGSTGPVPYRPQKYCPSSSPSSKTPGSVSTGTTAKASTCHEPARARRRGPSKLRRTFGPSRTDASRAAP